MTVAQEADLNDQNGGVGRGMDSIAAALSAAHPWSCSPNTMYSQNGPFQ